MAVRIRAHRSAGVAECCVLTKQLHLSTTPTAEIHFGIVGDIGTCSGYISSLWGSGRPAGGRRRLCPWWSASDRNSDRSPHKVCPSRSVRSMLAGGVGYFVHIFCIIRPASIRSSRRSPSGAPPGSLLWRGGRDSGSRPGGRRVCWPSN